MSLMLLYFHAHLNDRPTMRTISNNHSPCNSLTAILRISHFMLVSQSPLRRPDWIQLMTPSHTVDIYRLTWGASVARSVVSFPLPYPPFPHRLMNDMAKFIGRGSRAELPYSRCILCWLAETREAASGSCSLWELNASLFWKFVNFVGTCCNL